MKLTTLLTRLPASLLQPLKPAAWLPPARKLLIALALGTQALAILLTVAGLPARLRELAGPNTPAAWVSLYTLAWEILLAGVFFLTAGLILFYRRVDGLAVLLSLSLVALGATETGMTDALINPQWNPGGVGWHAAVYALRSLAMSAALLLLYVFPDGRFTPRWTRPLAALWIGLNLAWFFFPRLPFNPNDGPTWRATPLLSMAFGVAWFGTGILAQIIRYHRSPDPLVRLQTKWTAAGIIAAVLGTTLYYGLLADYNTLDMLRLGDLYFILRPPLHAISDVLFPICLAVAVLRFHLWDIHFIINRTLVYTSLTLVIGGLYVGVVAGLGALFQAQGNLWISLLAAALTAALFQPLRAFLQQQVDRLMYGQRRDPYRVIASLGQRLAGTVEAETVLPTVVETVADELKLPYVAIRLQQGDTFITPAAYGATPARGADLVALPLIYQGAEFGQLLAAPRPGEAELSPTDRRLLADLARQAGAAIHAAQMSSALRQARERLVLAREEERRRLRRDLHDGFGPRLASQALTLDVIARLVAADPAQAEQLLHALSEQTQQAVAEIRDLINGLRPPALDDLGLRYAIDELAQQLAPTGEAPRIRVYAGQDLPDLPAAVEVAAYRIAQEALTNVLRHAHASRCAVQLSVGSEPANDSTDVDRPAQWLILEVSDDGSGVGGGASNGIGLQTMRERALEVGGKLVIDSKPGVGTRLRAELPITWVEDAS